MPDFLKVERPYAPPTQCLICHTHSCPEGFVDTTVEIAGYGVGGGNAGRVYLCGWCVASAAKLYGFVDPGQHEKLRQDYGRLLSTVDQLEGELGQERDRVLVSIADLRKHGVKIPAKAAG